jgi:hypothetical protein
MTDSLLDLAGEQLRLLPSARRSGRPPVPRRGRPSLGKAAPSARRHSDSRWRHLRDLTGSTPRSPHRRLPPVVLGDLFHAWAGRVRPTPADRRWRGERETLEIQLVRGNHDRHAGDPPDDLRVNCVNSPAFLPPFVLRHEPSVSPEGYTLAGHLHPGTILAGRGLLRDRLPCFVVGPRVAVLPAFGSFTGLGMVRPEPGERVFVVADGEVLGVR